MGMANSNAPFGLRPIADNGTPWSGQGRLYSFAANDANNIFLGDPCVPTGAVDKYGVPIATIATAGDSHYIVGAFIGVANGPSSGGGSASFTVTRDLPVYRQASILNYGFICDDPNQLYVVQEDSVGGAIAVGTSAFENADLVSGSGSTVTGFSGWMLDSSTVASGSSVLQVKLLGLMRGPDNAIGNFAKWVVRLNLASLWNASGV